jgi:2-polyprenyl-3-methyl-5-hydroxy-6-metoxy-1,4-benzoquinol methylase
MPTLINAFTCQICELDQLKEVNDFASLPRITSDCRPFKAGGKLTVCMNCGAVQKIPDELWLQEINQIYGDYYAYSVANGEEQLVIDPITGQPVNRSLVIMNLLKNAHSFSPSTKAIDIGCGGGVTLKAISEIFPSWELYGHELGAGRISELKKIKNFKELFTGDIQKISQKFNFISMIHSLEHFTQPLKTLRDLKTISHPNGNLFIQVCNIEENPFDILVADHLMHFSPDSLSNIVNHAGFMTKTTQTNWVKKEISLLSIENDSIAPVSIKDPNAIYAKISEYVNWLVKIIENAKSVAQDSKPFGIFGTSIAASWLATELGNQVEFFVDEDPHRIGRNYMGKQIFSPENVPETASVYLALAPTLAKKISQRMQHYSWSIIEAPYL